MKRIVLLVAALLVAASMMAACGSSKEVNLETVETKAPKAEETVQNQTADTQEKPDSTTQTQENTEQSQADSTQTQEQPAEQTPPQETREPQMANGGNTWFTEVVSAAALSQSKGSLEWKNANGDTVGFANGGGKLYLLDVWAQWCPPCRASTPTMISIYNKYKNNGLVVIGINTDEVSNLEVAKEFAQSEGINYSIVHDPTSSKIRGVYVGNGIPAFTLLDNTGEVLFTNEGAITEGSEEANKLESVIRAKLGL